VSSLPSRKYRVLLATDAYPPLLGGADRAVQLLGNELWSRGHRVEVATAWQPNLPAYEDDGHIPVHRLRDSTSRVRFLSANPYKHGLPPLPDPEATWRIHRLIRTFQPDIVHSYGWITYSCAVALWRSPIPLVVSMRDYGNVCSVRTMMHHNRDICSGPGISKCLSCATDFYGPVKGPIAVAGVLGGRRPLVRRLAGLHYNSSYMREIMHRHLLGDRDVDSGPPPEAVVPTFRDDSRDSPPDHEILARLPDEPFILFVGALRRVKGVPLLLDAYEKLREPRPPLVMIGTREIDTPPEIPAGVLILESVPHGTVMAAWERALFGVFPSIWPEPFGNVVHEAMSRGCPSIGTAPGGHRDMITDEENGLLVSAGDAEQLVAAMQRLVDDSSLRERLGRSAAIRARDFTAESAMPKILRLYQDVVLSSRSTRRRDDRPTRSATDRLSSDGGHDE
jgi:glycosyltransferase involved in cell wall biosynthesis